MVCNSMVLTTWQVELLRGICIPNLWNLAGIMGRENLLLDQPWVIKYGAEQTRGLTQAKNSITYVKKGQVLLELSWSLHKSADDCSGSTLPLASSHGKRTESGVKGVTGWWTSPKGCVLCDGGKWKAVRGRWPTANRGRHGNGPWYQEGQNKGSRQWEHLGIFLLN